ncbi:ABC transporter ATP-binding protein [Salinarchaeum laminariae]|uniref:ABC transporter ATP-binding protein n=1 Tax=Salinarchaeum laminariae TaxID=869888 RepID=UPI0020C12AF3
MTLLRTRGLTKRFGGLTAVDSVDFGLGAGECVSLIGPNGAGKTTFFNLLTGTLVPSGGTVEYRSGGSRAAADGGARNTTAQRADGEAMPDGGAVAEGGSGGRPGSGAAADDWQDITDASPDETARLGIHRSYQITNIFPASTVLENVRIAAQAHGTDSWRLWRNAGAFGEYEAEAWQILERVGLDDKADLVADTLSHGQKRHLEVAIALAGDPDVLLMDEPTAGVSRDGVDRIVSLIDDVAADHAILIVEHNMDVVMDVSDRIAVLHQGSLIADDEPEAVRADPAVQRAYLGGYGDEEDESGGGTGGADDRSETADDGVDTA